MVIGSLPNRFAFPNSDSPMARPPKAAGLNASNIAKGAAPACPARGLASESIASAPPFVRTRTVGLFRARTWWANVSCDSGSAVSILQQTRL